MKLKKISKKTLALLALKTIMNLFAKIFAILNLAVALMLVILLLSALSTPLTAIIASPIVLLVILGIVFIGLLNSIFYIWKNNWNLSGASKVSMLFFVVPIVNAFIVLILGSMGA